MTKLNQLAEQRIDQYASRLKHIDGLLERLSKGGAGSSEHADIHAQIPDLKNERDRFSMHLDGLKQSSNDNLQKEMIEKSGPMAIWDALAQKLEKLVERFER